MSNRLISDDSIAKGLQNSFEPSDDSILVRENAEDKDKMNNSKSLISDDSIARGLSAPVFEINQEMDTASLISDASIAKGLTTTSSFESSYYQKNVQEQLFLERSENFDSDSESEEVMTTPNMMTKNQRLHQVQIKIQKYKLELMKAKSNLIAHMWAKFSIEIIMIKREVMLRKSGKSRRVNGSGSDGRGGNNGGRGKYHNNMPPAMSLLNVTIPETSEDSPLGTPLYELLGKEKKHKEEAEEEAEEAGKNQLLSPEHLYAYEEEEFDLVLFDPTECSREWLIEAWKITRCCNRDIPHPKIFRDMLDKLPLMSEDDLLLIHESQEQIALEHIETF
jgi:hypothetical protein